jgi:exopolyphosphatase/guanosine-5'-triphosphate,3'-diphosphate pyrophosphatase
MCRKFNVELRNARHVAKLSTELFDALRPLHKFPSENGKLLEAAAYLHNVGHFISDTGHHKHSAYIVTNSDMPGYTDQERMLIALLCRYHRKSMPSTRHGDYGSLSAEAKRLVDMLTPLLRIAIGLDTGGQQKVASVDCQLVDNAATMSVQAQGDAELELWGAERAADTFRQVYGTPLAIVKTRK